jgi:hypothetical protein
MRVIPVTAVQQRGFGETYRRDAWWTTPAFVFLVLGSFVIYATWAAHQNAHYTFGPYLSPFYSPELFGASPHAWFGPKPAVWPSWLPFSPALLILPFPGLFRFTCYYYRGAYYKSFWADPPGCAVGEPTVHHGYKMETAFPFILQNFHRYFLYLAFIPLFFLWVDAGISLVPESGPRLGLGSAIFFVNVILLTGFSLSCNSLRHLAGGRLDCFSCTRRQRVQYSLWQRLTSLNRHHMAWAWVSFFSVSLADVYVRLLALGIIVDPAIHL